MAFFSFIITNFAERLAKSGALKNYLDVDVQNRLEREIGGKEIKLADNSIKWRT